MSDIADIYSALMEARAACDALESWQRSADGRDIVRGRRYVIERGIAAHERLSAQLRDGRKHIEPPNDCMPTSCQCSAIAGAGGMPPCGYCTSSVNEEDE